MWTRFSATLLVGLTTPPPAGAVPDLLAQTRAAQQAVARLCARQAR